LYGSGHYGQFNESQYTDPGQGTSTSSGIDYDQTFSQNQHNFNVFNPNMMDEPPVMLGGRGGRTTRSTRNRGGLSCMLALHL